MTHLDLFSGLGVFSLVSSWVGGETVQFVENNPYCQAVLSLNFPGVPIHGDITTFNATQFRGVDLVTGGFPCQDVSGSNANGEGVFGKRSGLWFEMLRVVRESRPLFCIIENSPFLRVRGADRILFGLEREGYTCRSYVVSAGAAGAPHIRKRAILVAYAAHQSRSQANKTLHAPRSESKAPEIGRGIPRERLPRVHWNVSEPPVFGVDFGFTNRMERAKALGNTLCPQMIYPILQAIADQIKLSAK